MVKIIVKWGGQSLEISTDGSTTGIQLKQSLWEKTKVPVEKQKIIGFKGGLLSDHANLSDLGLKPGMRIMLVGTPEGSELKNTEDSTVFEEDLSLSEKLIVLKEHDIEPTPKGLINCGTSCYFNAVIQFLRPVKEFTECMKRLESQSGCEGTDASFCAALRSFYQKKELSGSADNPIFLVHLLRTKFSQFASMAPGNKNYMQQDAEECLSVLLEFLNSQRPPQFIDDLFSFQLEVTIRSTEDVDMDQPITKYEKQRILPCHLGSQLAAVDHLHQGIERSLNEKFMRFSSQLERQVECQKHSRIASLPKYLIIHFVRFEWKGRHELARTEAGRAKICRKVTFPSTFDIYTFTTQELQKKLQARRRICQPAEEGRNEFDSALKKHKSEQKSVDSSTLSCQETTSTQQNHPQDASENVIPSSVSLGEYELVSIITHQGRSADKGHYVAWTKRDNEIWWKFDDDQVTETTWKTIDLSGGRSDYHIAVLLLYKQKFVSVPQDDFTLINQEGVSQSQPSSDLPSST